MSILAVLAGAVVAASSTTPLPWFDLNDYPTKAFDREWQGVSSFEVIVNPSGRPVDCKVIKSSGYELLDRQACQVPMTRVRFKPAVGAGGQPAYGVYRSQVVWARPDRNPDALPRDLGPDLEVSVSRLPAGITAPLGLELAYFVDADGKASDCAPMANSRAQPAAVVDVACRALLEKLPRQPVTANGTTVAAVHTAAVRVSAAK